MAHEAAVRKGDLVFVVGTRGWDTCVEDYGLHEVRRIRTKCLGLILERRRITCRVLVGSDNVWMELKDLEEVGT